MRRREFLLRSSAAVAAAGLGGCTRNGERVPSVFAPVHDLLAKDVAEKRMPGAVWLVAQGDDVIADTVGMSAVGGTAPMARDTIFRIASMTKAISASAVMMLVEEGKLAIEAPVERWLPELADRKVLRQVNGPLDDVVPAVRPITVHDVLSFTNGFGALFDNSLPIQQEIDKLQLVNGAPVPMTPHAPDEWMRRIGSLPLMHQPGARWMYNTGSLLQGVLVRRAAGQDFDSFLNERIFAPLGMRDTAFFVPPEKLNRFAGCGFFTDPQSGKTTRMDADGAHSAYTTKPVFPSGAGGLVSTVDDYLIFARMLLAGGVHQGRRLLSAESVRLMTTDRLTPEQRAASQFFTEDFFEKQGWGYAGVTVATAPDGISQTPGRYGWDGGFGTSWYNDPNRTLISMVMTQSTDFLFSSSRDAYWRAVYAATAE